MIATHGIECDANFLGHELALAAFPGAPEARFCVYRSQDGRQYLVGRGTQRK
jgi:hypothetical protein